jgi:hypothetical protein
MSSHVVFGHSGVDFLYIGVVERHYAQLFDLSLQSTEFSKKLGAKVMKKELNFLSSKKVGKGWAPRIALNSLYTRYQPKERKEK